MDESSGPAEGVTPPPPTPIRPDFSRERAKLLWKGYYDTVETIEKKVVRRPSRPSEPSLRVGRVMEAGKGTLRYQNALLGNENPPLKPRSVAKPHPSSYLKKKFGADKYRKLMGAKSGDPYPGKKGL